MWIEGAQHSYIQYIREMLKNKYWEADVDSLERYMGSSWWEWLVGPRCFLWRRSRELLSGTRDRQKQWQVGPWS